LYLATINTQTMCSAYTTLNLLTFVYLFSTKLAKFSYEITIYYL